MTLAVPSSPIAPAWRFWLPLPPQLSQPLGYIPPDFALWDVTYQRTVRLANWRGKQPVILIFCRLGAEAAYSPKRYGHLVAIDRAYGQFRNAGAEVLAIAPIARRQGQAVVDDLGLTIALLTDETGVAFRAYHTGQALGAPLSAQFVLDAQGRLRYGHLFSLLHPHAEVERLLDILHGL